MPFTVNPSSYIGGQLLSQGIQSGASSLSDALKQYGEDKAKAAMADTTVHFAQQNFPDTISPEDLQRYNSANLKEKASIALGVQSNLANMLFSQRQTGETREQLARTNLYSAQAQKNLADAAETTAAGGAPKGKIYSDDLGGYVTPAQAARAQRLTPEGQIQSNYGLTPADIFNSKIHEAGTVTVDPSTGAKKFTNDPNGDQIRIGGATGVTMPMAEHEIYKRQLLQRGYNPDGTRSALGGAPGGAGGGGTQNTQQQQAITILQQGGKPVTTANINAVIQKMGGGGGGAAAAGAAPSPAPGGSPAAVGAGGSGPAWLQSTDAQGNPYWYTNEGDYSQTAPGG